MHIGLTGATGFVGSRLIDVALRRGHEIVAFTRQPEKTIPGCEMRRFSLDAPPDIEGCEALAQLAGESVAGIWSSKKKRAIVESRVLGTRRLVEAIQAARVKPEVLVSGSAVGFYGDRGEEELTESSAAGRGFLAETVKAWETEASRAEGVRVVLLRTSIVLGRKGGALAVMEPAFKIGLGAVLGKRAAMDAVDSSGGSGISHPVRHREYGSVWSAQRERALAGAERGVLRNPWRAPPSAAPPSWRVPAWALKAALGGFSAELLESKRALPAVATEHGFGVSFLRLGASASQICAAARRWGNDE